MDHLKGTISARAYCIRVWIREEEIEPTGYVVKPLGSSFTGGHLDG